MRRCASGILISLSLASCAAERVSAAVSEEVVCRLVVPHAARSAMSAIMERMCLMVVKVWSMCD